jgi:hypothetical protein
MGDEGRLAIYPDPCSLKSLSIVAMTEVRFGGDCGE